MEDLNKDLKTPEEPIQDISTNSPKRVQRINHVLNYIREHAPITPYALAKEMEISYTEIHRIVKDLEYCGLIAVRVVLGEYNRAHKLITIPDNKEATLMEEDDGE